MLRAALYTLLAAAGAHPDAYEQRVWSEARHEIQPFDVIGFTGTTVEALIQIVDTCGPVGHLGIVVTSAVVPVRNARPDQLLLWESRVGSPGATGPVADGGPDIETGEHLSGCQVRDLDTILASASREGQTVLWFALRPEVRRLIDWTRVRALYRAYYHRAYPLDAVHLLSSVIGVLEPLRRMDRCRHRYNRDHTAFCSQLVTAALQAAGLIPLEVDASTISPHEFVAYFSAALFERPVCFRPAVVQIETAPPPTFPPAAANTVPATIPRAASVTLTTFCAQVQPLDILAVRESTLASQTTHIHEGGPRWSYVGIVLRTEWLHDRWAAFIGRHYADSGGSGLCVWGILMNGVRVIPRSLDEIEAYVGSLVSPASVAWYRRSATAPSVAADDVAVSTALRELTGAQLTLTSSDLLIDTLSLLALNAADTTGGGHYPLRANPHSFRDVQAVLSTVTAASSIAPTDGHALHGSAFLDTYVPSVYDVPPTPVTRRRRS